MTTPPRVLLLVAHPNPDSLNHALARAATEALEAGGVRVDLHDLHREGFDPRLSARELVERSSDDPQVEAHVRALVAADAWVVVHPVWFDQPPAILSGWVQRVVREGDAFEHAPEGGFRGLLRAREACVVTTQNAPYEAPDALDRYWRSFVLPAVGIERHERLAFGPVVTSDVATRRAWLETLAATCDALAGRLVAGT